MIKISLCSAALQMYMEKFRNLTYLEQQLEEYNKTEEDRMEVGNTTETLQFTFFLHLRKLRVL